MIPDPMVRLRELAPEWARWFVSDSVGIAWIERGPKYVRLGDEGGCWGIGSGRWLVTHENFSTEYALNLSTGLARFPDGTTIPARVWMRFYRKRIGAQP